MFKGLTTFTWQQPEILKQLREWHWDMVRLDGQTARASDAASVEELAKRVQENRDAGFVEIQMILGDPLVIPALRKLVDGPLHISSPNEPDAANMANMTAAQVVAWIKQAWPLCQSAGWGLDAPVISGLHPRGFKFFNTVWQLLRNPIYREVRIDVHCYDGWESIPQLLGIIGTHPWLISEFGYQSNGTPASEQEQASKTKAKFAEMASKYPTLEAMVDYQLNRGPGGEFGILDTDGRWLPAAKIFIDEDTEGDITVSIPLDDAIDSALGVLLNARFGAFNKGFEWRPINWQGGDETCKVVPTPDGYWAVLSPDGQWWLSVQPDGSLEGRPSNTIPGWWECFLRVGTRISERPKDPNPARIPVEFEVRAWANSIEQPPLSRLSVKGRRFVTADGRDIFPKGAIESILFARYARGEEIDSVLGELRDHDVRWIQVYGMCDGTSMQTGVSCYPQQDPQYFEKVESFCRLCALYNLYVYWVCFVNTQTIMPALSTQLEHWNKTIDTLLKIDNTILSEGNELDVHDNPVADREAFPRPSGLASCRGSNGGTHTPVIPGWDFSDFHSRRDDQTKMIADADLEELIAGYSGFVGTKQASMTGEGPHFAEQYEAGHRENDPDFARQLARASYPTLGFWFLSDDTLRGQRLGPTQKACLIAAMEALP